MVLKKQLFSAFVFVLFSFFSDQAVAKTSVYISHAHVESHPDHAGFLAFKDYIESHLGDKYEVEIFPRGILGPNEVILKDLKKNKVQIMAISTSNLEEFNRKYAIFSLPYLFTSEKAYEKFISNEDILSDLDINTREDGFRPIALFTAGARSFYSVKKISNVNDLRGKKFRVQSGSTNERMMEAFGASSEVMSFGDVYGALKKGIIDGAENNELALVDQKHGEFCKYYIYDRHQMCPDMIVIAETFLSQLSHDDLYVFFDAAVVAQNVEFEYWHKRVDEAKEKASAMGVKFDEVNVDEFRNKVLPIHQQLLREIPSLKKLYEKITLFNREFSQDHNLEEKI